MLRVLKTTAVLVLLSLGGLVPTPAQVLESERGDRHELPNYIIGREDVLQVSIYGEPELSAERVPVRPDGRISLPLVGDVEAIGRTPEGLAHEIEEILKEKVVAPAVTVIVIEIRSFKIYVMGNVQRPGEYVLGRSTTLLQGLSLAGGFTDFANTKEIALIREGVDGQRRIPINYRKILSGENLELNIRLKPGDTIIVP